MWKISDFSTSVIWRHVEKFSISPQFSYMESWNFSTWQYFLNKLKTLVGYSSNGQGNGSERGPDDSVGLAQGGGRPSRWWGGTGGWWFVSCFSEIDVVWIGDEYKEDQKLETQCRPLKVLSQELMFRNCHYFSDSLPNKGIKREKLQGRGLQI